MRNAASLPAEILTARRPVWNALSRFWLDTELRDPELAHIAEALAASPYSLDEIEAIHRYEVTPAVSANLLSIAGEWAGFDEVWLAQRCEANALRRRSFTHVVRCRLRTLGHRTLTAPTWQRVRRQVVELRRGSS